MPKNIYRNYFERYAAGGAILQEAPSARPDIIVTIPAHREVHLDKTLRSLMKCLIPCPVEVLVLMNFPDDAPANVRDFHKSQQTRFASDPDFAGNQTIAFKFMCEALPRRHAGVGLARKILMDEALRRVSEQGIILALDADCTVRENYFEEIRRSFSEHPEWGGASISFKHRIQSPDDISIANYELHLRYFVEAQKYIGLPYAYHTVGSAMAVRPEVYARTGGMNRRKAGEDFYFLQKIIPHGFGEINTTTVCPSGRESDRVPFGTGRAVSEFNSGRRSPVSYNPASIILIRKWVKDCLHQRKIDQNVFPAGILHKVDFDQNFDRILRQSKTADTFQRHFFHWFDGFLLMKLLHLLREHDPYRDIPTMQAANWLLHEMHDSNENMDTFDLLRRYRRIQKVN